MCPGPLGNGQGDSTRSSIRGAPSRHATHRSSGPSWSRLGQRDASISVRYGVDLKTAQLGWPMGMPLIRKLDAGLWEVRTRLRDRVVLTPFTVEGGTMVILHAFAKKGAKAPDVGLEVARRRFARLKGHPR